ncbi:hypothetical protein EV714DRAFT_249253 [Schizophyllum commune]
MRPSLIRRVAFVSFRLATRAARCDENSRRSVQFSSSYRHSTPCSPCCCRSPDARTGGIRRTHPANDKRPATRLLRPRRADGFHARRPSESPILSDAESSLIQPALRYLHQNLLEGGRCLSAGHLIRIAMRARLSISACLAALRPPQACLLAPERARGQAGPPRAYLVQSCAASASIAKAGAVGLRVHSWASLAVRWIPPVVRWVSLATRLARRTRAAGAVRRAHCARSCTIPGPRSLGRHTNVR